MAAVADGGVGGEDWPSYHAVIREDPGGQAAPGDGVSGLSGDHSAGRQVLSSTHGSRSGACATDGRVPLPQHRIDSEELTGPAAAGVVAGCAIGNAGAARQHSWSGVLRVSHSPLT